MGRNTQLSIKMTPEDNLLFIKLIMVRKYFLKMEMSSKKEKNS